MNYLKKTFSVAVGGKDYSDGWERAFRPVQLQRRLADGSYETVSRHRTMEEAAAELVGLADGGIYRAVEEPAN